MRTSSGLNFADFPKTLLRRRICAQPPRQPLLFGKVVNYDKL